MIWIMRYCLDSYHYILIMIHWNTKQVCVKIHRLKALEYEENYYHFKIQQCRFRKDQIEISHDFGLITFEEV